MNKNELRKQFLNKRNEFSDVYKRIVAKKIADFLFDTEEYKTAEIILVYVSVGSEVHTDLIISNALDSGKIVAVPFCEEKLMNFRIIKSESDLVPGKFDIPTAPDTCAEVKDFKSALCIVPALSVDKYGNRLGYGGGYYDRFLSAHPETKRIVICYEVLLSDELPSESFDIKIDRIITDGGVLNA